jgi:glutamyl-Q tRNA(Asp) synthetase
VRIDDIDPPREIEGATDAILAALDAHGFEFPAPLYQSSRLDAYDELIQQLLEQGLAYPCACSRKEIEALGQRGATGLIYPGTCRHGLSTTARAATSVRVYTDNNGISFTDGLQGPQHCQLESTSGDFLVRRGDGLTAYQLAVVADDHAQGVTEVVRGTDLLDATFMQLHLQKLAGFEAPKYLHFPVVVSDTGSKLSKQTGAPAIDNQLAATNLYQALESLGQSPATELKHLPINALWEWALENWSLEPLVGLTSLADRSMMMQ